jgi:transcriptional regulator with XRE-family HTH domain
MQILTATSVRTARAAAGWSAADLADHARVSRRTVIRLEAGNTPNVKILQALTAAFADAGISIEISEDGRERVTYGGQQPQRTLPDA